MNENEKEIYVLMQRFKPIIYENYIIRHNCLNKFICTKISNELGIFGVLVRLVMINKCSYSHILIFFFIS